MNYHRETNVGLDKIIMIMKITEVPYLSYLGRGCLGAGKGKL